MLISEKRVYEPWPVILNVVLLDLLDMVVGFRVVHALNVLPDEVAQQTEHHQDNRLQPEYWAGVQSRDDTLQLGREIGHRRDVGVGDDKYPPDKHTTGNRHHMVLGPVTRHKRCLTQHCEQSGVVHGSTPDPMARDLAIALDEIA